MAAHTAEEISKHIRVYIAVFIALAVLTVITVWAAHLEVSKAMHIAIALFIATIKGSLVAAYFMHLISEGKLIASILIATAFFFIFMLVVTYFAGSTVGPTVKPFW